MKMETQVSQQYTDSIKKRGLIAPLKMALMNGESIEWKKVVTAWNIEKKNRFKML